MGLLANFFVAPLEDALRYEESLAHRPVNAAQYQLAEYQNLGPLELGLLWAILLDEEWDSAACLRQ